VRPSLAPRRAEGARPRRRFCGSSVAFQHGTDAYAVGFARPVFSNPPERIPVILRAYTRLPKNVARTTEKLHSVHWHEIFFPSRPAPRSTDQQRPPGSPSPLTAYGRRAAFPLACVGAGAPLGRPQTPCRRPRPALEQQGGDGPKAKVIRSVMRTGRHLPGSAPSVETSRRRAGARSGLRPRDGAGLARKGGAVCGARREEIEPPSGLHPYLGHGPILVMSARRTAARMSGRRAALRTRRPVSATRFFWERGGWSSSIRDGRRRRRGEWRRTRRQ